MEGGFKASWLKSDWGVKKVDLQKFNDDDDDSGGSDDVLLPMNRVQRFGLFNGWSLEKTESVCEWSDATIVFGICCFFSIIWKIRIWQYKGFGD